MFNVNSVCHNMWKLMNLCLMRSELPRRVCGYVPPQSLRIRNSVHEHVTLAETAHGVSVADTNHGLRSKMSYNP